MYKLTHENFMRACDHIFTHAKEIERTWFRYIFEDYNSYLDIIKYPTEHILRYWDENSPDYNKDIFDHGEPYDFEYFQHFIYYMKDKDMADKLTRILCQNPTYLYEKTTGLNQSCRLSYDIPQRIPID